MSSHPVKIEAGNQVKAARALLGWEQSRLAQAAGVSLPTIHRLEKLGPERCSLGNLFRIQAALSAAGVEFIGKGGFQGDGGLGVRLSC